MAVSITQKPKEPVLARQRQQWIVKSTDHEARDRYRVEFVIPQNDGLPDIILIQVPDAAGNTYYELSNILDALLDHSLPSGFRFGTDNGTLKTFEVQVIEKWFERTITPIPGGEPIIGPWQERSNTLTVTFESIKAGLGHRAQQFDYHDHFTDKFLSYTSNEMKVRKESANYLSFLFAKGKDLDGLAVEVIIFYDDGNRSTKNLPVPFSSNFEEKVMILDASYKGLLLEDDERPDTAIVAYDVRLTVSDGSTETVYQRVQITDEKIIKGFLFANSAGGWSTLHCFGNFEAGSSFNMGTAEVNVPFNNTPELPQFKNFSVTETESFKASTGYIERESDMIQHCKEFLRSRYRYEIDAEGNFTPIVMDNAKFMYDKSQIGLIALQFDYRYAFENQLFDKV